MGNYKVELTAEDPKKGMTARELERHLTGCPDDSDIKVHVTVGGRIKKLIFERPRDE